MGETLSWWIARATFCAAVSVAGCSQSDADGITTLGGPGGPKGDDPAHHPAGEPAVAPDRFQWADLSEEDVSAFKQTLLGGVSTDFRRTYDRDDNPAAARVQAWIDAFHARVIELFELQFPGTAFPIPHPEVMLVADSEVNAWVTHVPVCLDAEIEMATDSDAHANVEVAAIGPDGVDALQRPPFGNPSAPLCASTTLTTEVAEFVDYYNRAVAGPCELELVERDGERPLVRVWGEGCGARRGPAFASAQTAAFYATAPRIMVTTAMMLDQAEAASLEQAEEQFTAVLAHELAHYYRAHPVHSNRYGYFYELNEAPEPIAPAAVNDSPELQAQRHRLFAGIPPVRVPDSGFNGRLTAWLAWDLPELLYLACADAEVCPASCEQAADLAHDNFGLSLLATVIKTERRDEYLAFEQAVADCAPGVSIEAVDASGGGVLQSDLLQASIASSFWWLEEPPPEAATLADALAFLHARAETFDGEVAAFLAEIRGRNLGMFTVEQEADEMSLELLAAIGIDPIAAPLKHLATGKRHQQGHTLEDWERFQGMDMTMCDALFNPDDLRESWWEDGEYVYVPMGDIGTPHHGACYRVFDVSREILAHDYSIADPGAHAADPTVWQLALEEAQHLQNRPTPGG